MPKTRTRGEWPKAKHPPIRTVDRAVTLAFAAADPAILRRIEDWRTLEEIQLRIRRIRREFGILAALFRRLGPVAFA